MRHAFFLGGLIGFMLTAVAGLLSERPGEVVFRDAAIGCVVSAFLFRWFWSVVVKAFIEAAHLHRQQAAAAAQAGSEGSAPASNSPAAKP
jgi:hypothetical protein